MAGRLYFYDLIADEEIGEALEYSANSECGVGARSGIQYTDTAFWVEGRELKINGALRRLSAADFPGRLVAAKYWTPSGAPRWLLLVCLSDGFVSACDRLGNAHAEIGESAEALRYLAGLRRKAA